MLVRYEAACRALAEACSVGEVKDVIDKAVALKAYARQAKNKDLEADAFSIRVRAERRLGQMIAALRDAGLLAKGAREPGTSRGTTRVEEKPTSITFTEIGIDKNLADRARKSAAIDEAAFEGRVSKGREKIQSAVREYTKAIFTGENDWYMPDEYLEAARQVLGRIELDPASSDAAQAKVRAERYYTREIDGLQQEWRGSVWLNPPYERALIDEFVHQMVEKVDARRVLSAIMLTHNYTDTAWFHAAAHACSALCFTRGRIRFYDADGEVASPTQGQAFFYFGADAAKFVEVFSISELARVDTGRGATNP
jgi:phage N-6-adenine-methyltransferase